MKSTLAANTVRPYTIRDLTTAGRRFWGKRTRSMWLRNSLIRASRHNTWSELRIGVQFLTAAPPARPRVALFDCVR